MIALVSVLSQLVVIVVVIGFMLRRHARMEPQIAPPYDFAMEPEANEEPKLDSTRSTLAKLGGNYQWYAERGRDRRRKAYLTKQDVESCL